MNTRLKVFEWARTVNPSQPLTAPVWKFPNAQTTSLDIVSFIGENCDVMTFHCYEKPDEVEAFIRMLRVFARPLICTEYMARTRGSTFQNTLPIFQKERVGAISFGLVAGKMQTHFPWGSKQGAPEPGVWFHDIFSRDGLPYEAAEVAFIKAVVARSAER